MKLIHLSDLHLGMRLKEFNLREDQEHILNQILSITDEHHPDCVIIAGDVYDKSVPSAEAVALFDYFLSELSNRELPVLVISGNHDSAERIAFGSQIMKKSHIYLSPVYQGKIEPVVLHDEFDEIRFYLLPFIRPANVRGYFPDKQIDSYTSAVAAVVESMNLNPKVRNVLVAHQFITGAQRSDSEEIYAGGLENIDASVFSDFDYVALGHIHRPQNITERIRYCGTPLKYSFSELEHQKSVTLVEIGEKDRLPKIETIPLKPMIDMQEIKGKFDEIMLMSASECYTRIILTDNDPVPDAIGRLRRKFPNLMVLEYDNQRMHTTADWSKLVSAERQSPLKIFSDFARMQNGTDLTPEQTEIVEKLIKEIWGGAVE